MAEEIGTSTTSTPRSHETPTKMQCHTASINNMPADENSESRTHKRNNYLDWDDYFMAVAFLSAQRSKDPSSQVGACIVNPDKKIVGIGYNGMPNNCDDDILPWGKDGEWLDQKYPYVCHAEMNAIMNKNSADVKDCTIYVTLFPCNECAKLIIQSGIRKIFYFSDKHHHRLATVASRKLLDLAKVGHEKYIPKQRTITVDFFKIDPDAVPSATSAITSP